VTLRLYFLRHGKAWSRADWREDDDLRPLTDAGEALVRAEGRAMKAMGLAPDVIVTSPLARARRTAEIVAEELGMSGRLVEDSRLAHGFDARRLAEIVVRHADAASLMLVGHEPGFSATVAELTGGGRVDFKKGGLARVDVKGSQLDDGILAWLLTPAQITGE
jgi:phosphohistidine phosphatase